MFCLFSKRRGRAQPRRASSLGLRPEPVALSTCVEAPQETHPLPRVSPGREPVWGPEAACEPGPGRVL